MRILGSNFFGQDSSLFLLDTIHREIFAMSTERCTRIKHDTLDVTAILRAHPIADVDAVAHGYADYRVEREVFGSTIDYLEVLRASRDLFRPRTLADADARGGWRRLVRASLASPGAAMRYAAVRARRRLGPRPLTPVALERFIRSSLRGHRIDPRTVRLYDHHLSHAASAYYFSPFAGRALVLTIDGYGDEHFSKAFVFEGRSRELIAASRAEVIQADGGPDLASIGYIYRNFTEALGLRPNSDEGKVEALAAYGARDERLYRDLRACVTVSERGFAFDREKVGRFYDLGHLRAEAARVGQESFAWCVQRWLEDIVVEHIQRLQATHDLPRVLCLAGGVCANVILGLNILERTSFDDVYVFPAMSDAGVAAGSAALAALEMGEDVEWLRACVMPYFGDRVSENEVPGAVARAGAVRAEKVGAAWPELAAAAVASGRIVAVVRGRMEFGPRALGHRSILADPRDPLTRERLNASVKRRPWYQPFCPSILEEERARLFERSLPHKHMAIALRMREGFRDQLPSAVHVDGTARPQFVEERDDPEYYRVLRRIKELTGFGVVVNTSFNLHGRTIVRTADDAITDFLDSGMDELYLEGYRVTRTAASSSG